MLRRCLLALVAWGLVASTASAQSSAWNGPGGVNLSAANECALLNVAGMGTGAIEVVGTYTGTVSFTVSVSGSTYTSTATAAGWTDGSTTSTGQFSGAVAGFRVLRACMTSYTSGTARVILSAAGTGGTGGAVTLEGAELMVGAQPADDPHFVQCSDGSAAGACVVTGSGTAGTAATGVVTVQGIASMTPILATVTATNLDVQIGGSDTVTVSATNLDVQSGGADLATASAQSTGNTSLASIDTGITALAATVAMSGTDLNVICTSGCGGSGGTSVADDADFTAGTTDFNPVGGFYQSSVTACTDGDTCAFGITAQRTAKVTLFSAAGAEITPSTDATHDGSALTTGPQAVGYASTAAPSAVSAAGDAVRMWASLNGAAAQFPVAHTVGGCTPHSIISANTVNETQIKATAGQLYTLNVTNIGANEVFFKLYNDTAANTDETDTPVQRYVIPGNAAGAGNTLSIPVGMAFSTAITYRITGAAADNDTTAIAANEVLVSACYL